MESFADWAGRHCSGKLLQVIPKFWFPRIVLSVCHLRVLRAALEAHPNVEGYLTFEDDATDWVSFACNYLTQQAARQMVAMPNVGNIDWMFWSAPRPDVVKPYPVTQRGRSLYH